MHFRSLVYGTCGCLAVAVGLDACVARGERVRPGDSLSPHGCIDQLIRRGDRIVRDDTSSATGGLHATVAAISGLSPVIVQLESANDTLRRALVSPASEPHGSSVPDYFHFDSITPGTYQLRLWALGYAGQVHEVRVIAGVTDSLCFIMTPVQWRRSEIQLLTWE
jgi:hypothetical protein